MKTTLKFVRNQFANIPLLVLTGLALATATATSVKAADTDNDDLQFQLIRSKGLTAFPTVAPHAQGRVKIDSVGPVEIMTVKVWGLPPNTDFDFFVIQVPNAPFGMAWYQGDIETNHDGVGFGQFVGRFNPETFIVSPASLPAPIEFHHTFPDVSPGVKTGPVHTYHLGLWFNDPKDVVKAGGLGTVTPFNGEHDAGVQVLNTGEFPDLAGPLLHVKP
ncbi:MAG TPA: hypothetical protein VGD78_07605 [Chthoniobacterales bacterium]